MRRTRSARRLTKSSPDRAELPAASYSVSKLANVGTFDELSASPNPNEQKRGFEFENICQWFLQNDPEYASRLKRVWLWKEWPGRWREGGAGVDLVAEDTDTFSYRLLISTTTNGLHHIAQETVAAQEKPVLIIDLPDLRKSPVDWPERR